MSSYSGSASIVLRDGTVIGELAASLVAPDDQFAGTAWFGQVSGDFDPFDLMDGPAILRLPDGREAWFRLGRTDLVLPRQGVDIVGAEPPD